MSHFHSLSSPHFFPLSPGPSPSRLLLIISFISITRSLPSARCLNYDCQGSKGGGENGELWAATSVTPSEPSVVGGNTDAEQLNCKEYGEEEMQEGHTFITDQMKSQQHSSCLHVRGVCQCVCVLLHAWLCVKYVETRAVPNSLKLQSFICNVDI